VIRKDIYGPHHAKASQETAWEPAVSVIEKSLEVNESFKRKRIAENEKGGYSRDESFCRQGGLRGGFGGGGPTGKDNPWQTRDVKEVRRGSHSVARIRKSQLRGLRTTEKGQKSAEVTGFANKKIRRWR